jgi:hypothetical protein
MSRPMSSGGGKKLYCLTDAMRIRQNQFKPGTATIVPQSTFALCAYCGEHAQGYEVVAAAALKKGRGE